MSLFIIFKPTWSDVDNGGWELAEDHEWVDTAWTVWIHGVVAINELLLSLGAVLINKLLQVGACWEGFCRQSGGIPCKVSVSTAVTIVSTMMMMMMIIS